jgi:hypothetical protein
VATADGAEEAVAAVVAVAAGDATGVVPVGAAGDGEQPATASAAKAAIAISFEEFNGAPPSLSAEALAKAICAKFHSW